MCPTLRIASTAQTQQTDPMSAHNGNPHARGGRSYRSEKPPFGDPCAYTPDRYAEGRVKPLPRYSELPPDPASSHESIGSSNRAPDRTSLQPIHLRHT